MLAVDRQARILETVRSRGVVRLRELTEELGVSVATVRRDVTTLAERGLVDRSHGSIKSTDSGNGDHSPALARVGESVEAVPGQPEKPAFTLGMLVPSTTYYYPDVVRGARAAAATLGARLVLGISYYDPATDRLRVDEMLAGGVDGLLITTSVPLSKQDETTAWLASLPVPTVLVERRITLGTGIEHVESVASDHVYGACLAVRHLVGLGHNSITLVVRRDTPNRWLIEEGYKTGLDEFGLKRLPPITTPHPEYDPATFDHAIKGVVDDVVRGRISALLVHNDQDAIVLIQRLHGAGARVPRDVAVVSYDDEVAGLIDTPLTAVAPPKQDVGRSAVELLIARLAHGAERAKRHLILLPELRIRQSCGAARR
ncbi:DeoR/GlpR family transcriptional regulator [Phytoactinopolyspora alkaliphila]|uniref:DeoR/GlpR family transcriptional regulator n=1 Tax=Phytoactinopolyspora alkaliphila TaxID=1783498 RepID=A0A6N9YH00_9ACTN|nr:substrate-binding domain-containing protein [Phytoactinopolyspora alkaliphila]NED94273.1 DeoR/GlpR family transcriptional regulator [Phytoactinopolyspora alkaliphila]